MPERRGHQEETAMRSVLCALLAFVALSISTAFAQSFPNRPVTIVVGSSAGGGTDVTTRYFASHLQQRLGQQIIVENRPGGNGSLAAKAVIASPPDGYTLLLNSAETFHP